MTRTSRSRSAATLALLATLCWSGLVAGEGPINPSADADAEASVPRSDVVVLGARALFGSDGAALSAEGEASLERLVDKLARHGDILAIRVVGHADGVGPAAYNQRLSERRADTVSRALARRYPDVSITREGAGESEPVASNATPEGRARNRRVEIHVVSLGDDRRRTRPRGSPGRE